MSFIAWAAMKDRGAKQEGKKLCLYQK
jgi:hypothetical protein